MKNGWMLIFGMIALAPQSASFANKLSSGQGIGTPLGKDATKDLSGAFFDNNKLWLVTNGDSYVWRTSVKRGLNGVSVAVDKKWKISEKGDFEAITANVDLQGKVNRLFLLDEGGPSLLEYEFRDNMHTGVLVKTWFLSMKPRIETKLGLSRKHAKKLFGKGGPGSEGLTWIPEGHYSLLPRTNNKGKSCEAVSCAQMPSELLDGMFLVAHQNKGRVYAFRLPADSKFDQAFLHGAYKTSRGESSGLEYDKGSESLYIWHGGKIDKDNPDGVVNVLERAKLRLKGGKLMTTGLFPYPNGASIRRSPKRKLNFEGVAIDPLTNELYLTADDEKKPHNLVHVKIAP
jgi:hypothetical protein